MIERQEAHYRGQVTVVKLIWVYWCKAMGSHAYDNDKKDDHIHLTIRTFWFLLHITTCLFIIIGNGRLLQLW
jgi:hypothetical protein